MLNTLAEYSSHGPPVPPLLLTALELGTRSPLTTGLGPGSLSTQNAWWRPDLSLVSCLKQLRQGSIKKKKPSQRCFLCSIAEKFILTNCSQILCMLLHFSSSSSFLAEKFYHSVLLKIKDTNIRSCYYFETALPQMVF